MKKVLAVSAVAALLPLLVTVESAAVQTTYRVAWDPYTPTQATIVVECMVGPTETIFTERATVPATQNSVNFQMDTNPGDTIQCQVKARWGNQESLPSGVASYSVPFPPLGPPSGVSLSESPRVPGAL